MTPLETAANKLAKALAYRTMSFEVYCQEHEYDSVFDAAEAKLAYSICKMHSNSLKALTTEEIEELLGAI